MVRRSLSLRFFRLLFTFLVLLGSSLAIAMEEPPHDQEQRNEGKKRDFPEDPHERDQSLSPKAQKASDTMTVPPYVSNPHLTYNPYVIPVYEEIVRLSLPFVDDLPVKRREVRDFSLSPHNCFIRDLAMAFDAQAACVACNIYLKDLEASFEELEAPQDSANPAPKQQETTYIYPQSFIDQDQTQHKGEYEREQRLLPLENSRPHLVKIQLVKNFRMHMLARLVECNARLIYPYPFRPEHPQEVRHILFHLQTANALAFAAGDDCNPSLNLIRFRRLRKNECALRFLQMILKFQ
ncbi:MAG: hypothetical protein K2P93_01430 [Alphaproteobacteria bacterium]|nr:hypothetical protein [Alphaproteobacteria bacterium]